MRLFSPREAEMKHSWERHPSTVICALIFTEFFQQKTLCNFPVVALVLEQHKYVNDYLHITNVRVLFMSYVSERKKLSADISEYAQTK